MHRPRKTKEGRTEGILGTTAARDWWTVFPHGPLTGGLRTGLSVLRHLKRPCRHSLPARCKGPRSAGPNLRPYSLLYSQLQGPLYSRQRSRRHSPPGSALRRPPDRRRHGSPVRGPLKGTLPVPGPTMCLTLPQAGIGPSIPTGSGLPSPAVRNSTGISGRPRPGNVLRVKPGLPLAGTKELTTGRRGGTADFSRGLLPEAGHLTAPGPRVTGRGLPDPARPTPQEGLLLQARVGLAAQGPRPQLEQSQPP